MTGTLRAYRDPPPRRTHDHVDIVLDDGTLLRYRDPRRFGAMLWLPAWRDGHPLLDSLGPEPFDAAFDAAYLWRATRSRRAAIKLVLMDNHVVTGVGNIYANEALFRAGIHPGAPANRLSKTRLAKLVDAVRDVLQAAIAKGGSTLRDYVGSDGASGYFQLEYFVYGREDAACRVCGKPIRQGRQGGRSSFYCTTCQRR
jgi:formamidopyrimidine-DNA glycosylase